MKKIIYSIIALTMFMSANAQTTEAEKALTKQNADSLDGWKTGGVFAVNLSQTSLTNWSAGGQNSVSVNGLLSVFANLRKGKSTWDNSLDLGYGMLQQGDEGVRKTDDKIDFTSKYGRKATKNWYYAGLVNFKSQMTAGYNYPDDSNKISNLLAPGYVLGAIGMDYKPSDAFTMFISPLTLKMTIVNDEDLANFGAFGVDPATYDDFGNLIDKGKTLRTEMGGYLRTQYIKDIMENVKLQAKLELFSNYSEEPTHIDVNGELLLAFKVNKFISATISAQVLYDHDIDIAIDTNGDDIPDKVGPRTQFKEVLGIGLNYKF